MKLSALLLTALILAAGMCSGAKAAGIRVTSLTLPATYADGTPMDPSVVAWVNICLNPEGQPPQSISDCAAAVNVYVPNGIPFTLEFAEPVAGRYCVYGQTVVDATASHPVDLPSTESAWGLLSTSSTGQPACMDYLMPAAPNPPSQIEVIKL